MSPIFLPRISAFKPGAHVNFAVPKGVAQNGSIQLSHPAAPTRKLAVRIRHEWVVDERPRQHLSRSGKLAATHSDNLQSGPLAHRNPSGSGCTTSAEKF
jgi:hypothetical protein